MLKTSFEIADEKVPRPTNVIPKMTDQLGRYWRQPDRSEIEVDSTHALMSKASFDMLPEYSGSIPTGVYFGKMWKRRSGHGWLFCWYAPNPDPDMATIEYRLILTE